MSEYRKEETIHTRRKKGQRAVDLRNRGVLFTGRITSGRER